MGSPDANSVVTPRRVLLVWPVFQAVSPRPFENFLKIALAAGRACPGYLFGVHVIERSSLVAAMNEVGDLVLRGPSDHGTGWDAALVFDDDCFPPVDVIPRLLTRCFDEGHPFVAGAGVMRDYPFTTTAARSYEEGVTAVFDEHGHLDHFAGFHWLDDLPEALVPVDFCGMPAAIIHRRCFEIVRPPWFGDLDVRGKRVTHDSFFCAKLTDADLAVLVDGTIRCGHLVPAPIVTFENRASARASVQGNISERSDAGESVSAAEATSAR